MLGELSRTDLGAIAASCALLAYVYPWPGRKLDHIPAVGSRSHFLSFIGGFQFLFKARQLVQQGCNEQGTEGIFKVPNVTRWLVIVHGQKYIDEYRKIPENVLSFHDSIFEQLQIPFTLGQSIADDPYHIPLVRTSLTRNLPNFFPALHEEVIEAFNTYIPVKEEWIKVKMLETMMPVVARASNLVLVGAPLCRNEDYLDLNVQFTIVVNVAAAIMNLLPNFLRPLVSRFGGIDSMVDRCVKHIQPVVEERRRNMEEHGKDYADKPNDMLSWLMDAASEEEGKIRSLARRILTVNLAAIHTSSMTFTQALYDLAVHPECVQELRDEIGPIVEQHGWTNAALGHMVKVDSFLKESQRLNALGFIVMDRTTRQPFTFSDGTAIPAGTHMSVAAHAAHTSPSSYSDPDTFLPFRFVEKREHTNRKLDFVSTHTDALAFGHGLHACPGRFFAANELKLMLAHVVMTYDVRMEE
ncbi:hypothetical protein H0H92_004102, partial [Tricholoma furcatifolium]